MVKQSHSNCMHVLPQKYLLFEFRLLHLTYLFEKVLQTKALVIEPRLQHLDGILSSLNAAIEIQNML